jgi:hypothetical protein
MAGVFKELYSDQIKEAFYADGSWLNELTNYDAFVENDVLNLPVAGAGPTTVVDNTSWPMTPAQRTDVNKARTLLTLDTTPTHLTNVDELETAYDKAESILRQHTATLRDQAALRGSYNLLPAADGAQTPVVQTTGALNTFRAVTRADIIKLASRFDQANMPRQGRTLLLDSVAMEEILREDITLFNQISAAVNGTLASSIYGFKPYIYNSGHLYTSSNVPDTLGGAYNAGDKWVRAIAFINSEVFRAMGSVVVRAEDRWADYRGWLIGAQLRFLAGTIADRGVGVLITATS